MSVTDESNYGVIPDRMAWELPLNAAATRVVPPFQLFTMSAPDEDEHPLRIRPLARSRDMALYVRAFEEGGGENGLHAHPDDAVWLVLEGHAAFYGEGGRLLGELDRQDGVLVPRLTSYRFVCTGATVMARISAAHHDDGTPEGDA